MIQADINEQQHSGCIVLRPTVSADWRTNLYFIYAVGVVAMGTAVFFAFHGAWLILPFAGLEVAALAGVVYVWYRHHTRREVLHFSDEQIILEKGIQQPREKYVYEKFWTRAMLKQPRHPWYPVSVVLRNRNAEIEIGQFLTEDEKRTLVSHLRQVMTVI
jgi:uncharacterized membrane protein